jgi:hypothetical protein
MNTDIKKEIEEIFRRNTEVVKTKIKNGELWESFVFSEGLAKELATLINKCEKKAYKKGFDRGVDQGMNTEVNEEEGTFSIPLMLDLDEDEESYLSDKDKPL